MEAEMSGGGMARLAHHEGLPWSDAAATFRAAEDGQPGALPLVERMCDRLAIALGAAVQLLNPDVIVIGGGVAGAGPRLADGVSAALERYGLASNRRGLRVTLTELSDRGGAIGAALLAGDAVSAPSPEISQSGAAEPRPDAPTRARP